MERFSKYKHLFEEIESDIKWKRGNGPFEWNNSITLYRDILSKIRTDVPGEIVSFFFHFQGHRGTRKRKDTFFDVSFIYF